MGLFYSGKFPNRIGSPVLERYRNEQEQSHGLLFTNKEEWWRMRQPINKVMMRANAALPYLADQSLIGDEFVELLKRNFEKGNGTHRAIMRVRNIQFYKYLIFDSFETSTSLLLLSLQIKSYRTFSYISLVVFD